jgi:cytochrome c biogenesis protein
LQLAQLGLSDSFLFGAPVLFQINEFKEVKASVFQVTRSPGKNIVYLGCLLLTLGVFAMFYIRERRVWCWITSSSLGQTHMHYAMSSTRRSMAVDQDFASFEQRLKEQYGINASQ